VRQLALYLVGPLALLAAFVFLLAVAGFETLNANQGAYLVVFTALLTTATIFYMILTGQLVEETRLMRKAQATPEVVVVLRPREEYINWMDLFIENIGQGAAYEIKFELPENATLGRTNLKEVALFQRGLPFLAAGQRIGFFAAVTHGEPPPAIEVKVTFKDSTGASHNKSYQLDVSLFKGLRQLGTPPLYKIAKEMEGVRSSLEKLARQLDVPEVIVYKREEYDAREKTIMERAFRGLEADERETPTEGTKTSEKDADELPPL
jgi:hypothetical protein